MSERLSGATLGRLPTGVSLPAYDRAALQCGVVHMGIGAFHRAHQAVYFDQALALGDPRWGVVGVSLRSPCVRDELVPQDGLYTLRTRASSDEHLRIIGAIRDVLVAPRDPARVVQLLAQPHVHLVTLTVTEKGYKLDPSSGELMRDDADIAADMRDLNMPGTAPGFLVAGLAARRRAGLAPFTAISCDNLPRNGRRLRDSVLALARSHDASLADWIERDGAFPNSMVDRIVPAPTAADRAQLAQRLGVEDRAAVSTESFCQWVIERRFAGPVPDFAAVGVQLTDDVAPWEHTKLRLLNGAHSAMAYLGGLAGIEYVHEFVTRPEGAAYVESLWNESASTLDAPRTLNLADYRAQLMARFHNSALGHRLRQIAIDGSQKLPQRLVAPLRERCVSRQSATMLALAVAAWMRWQCGIDDAGKAFPVEDPMASRTSRCLEGHADAISRVRSLLSLTGVFGADSVGDEQLCRLLAQQLERLETLGAMRTLQALVQ